MRSVVLVHGGMHGGWCWDKVRPLLEEDGWTVYTPTLTGLGDRAYLASPQITLSTHVQDVVSLIEAENLTDAVICGHSAAGMVITGVADTVPDRIHTLVYLDAIVPHEGESMFDILGPAMAAADQQQADQHGQGWRLPARFFRAADFGVTDPADAVWVERNLRDHPIRAFTDPIHLTGGINLIGEKICVRCTEHKNRPHLDRAVLDAEGKPGWTVQCWPSVHDVMITEPGRIRALLAGIHIEATRQPLLDTGDGPTGRRPVDMP